MSRRLIGLIAYPLIASVTFTCTPAILSAQSTISSSANRSDLPTTAAESIFPAHMSRRTTEQLVENARLLVAVDADGCLEYQPENMIVVCGERPIDREQRLPFPELAVVEGERISQPIPNGNPGYVYQGGCGIATDDRNCFKGIGIVTVGFGGPKGGPGDNAANLWQFVDAPVGADEYADQALNRPMENSSTEIISDE